MPNLTPADLARGLKWADTIETDPVAKDLLASLVVLNARELLELAARGMRDDLDLEEALRLNNKMMRHFDEACDLCERAQSERDELKALLKSIGETYPQRMMMAPLIAKARELTR